MKTGTFFDHDRYVFLGNVNIPAGYEVKGSMSEPGHWKIIPFGGMRQEFPAELHHFLPNHRERLQG